MKLFDLDSPLMQALNKVADLMWLNLLTFFCALPVITAGASFTAMHYMALKLVRNEEVYITRGFFKSFRENFRQSTVIWLILLLIFGILVGDFYIMNHSGIAFGRAFQTVIGAILILTVFGANFVFAVQAKFNNPVFRTMKNALAIGILQFPKAILMTVLYVLPLLLAVFFPGIFPIVFLFGISVPVFLSAMMYNKFFRKLEDRILETQGGPGEAEPEDDPDRIFSDKLDETLARDNRNGQM